MAYGFSGLCKVGQVAPVLKVRVFVDRLRTRLSSKRFVSLRSAQESAQEVVSLSCRTQVVAPFHYRFFFCARINSSKEGIGGSGLFSGGGAEAAGDADNPGTDTGHGCAGDARDIIDSRNDGAARGMATGRFIGRTGARSLAEATVPGVSAATGDNKPDDKGAAVGPDMIAFWRGNTRLVALLATPSDALRNVGGTGAGGWRLAAAGGCAPSWRGVWKPGAAVRVRVDEAG